MSYARSTAGATAYLADRVLNDAWIQEHDDVAYYFKAPMAFLEMGEREKAEKALAIAARYVEQGGAGSQNGAYAGIFQHYPWVWLCYAAVGLGQTELAERCYINLERYTIPLSGTGLVIEPYKGEGQSFEADVFATAEVVKVALLVGRLDTAVAAADTIARTLAANRAHMEGGRFYLRWTGEGQLALIRKEEAFYCIDQKSPDQLFFLLAFPVMTLLELAGAVGGVHRAATYRTAAMDMFEFLKGCAGIYESPWAHKLARAAAMAGDAETAIRIADFFVSLQQEAGCFQSDVDAMDTLDQTAEIIVWLQQIDKDLAATL